MATDGTTPLNLSEFRNAATNDTSALENAIGVLRSKWKYTTLYSHGMRCQIDRPLDVSGLGDKRINDLYLSPSANWRGDETLGPYALVQPSGGMTKIDVLRVSG